MSQSRPTPGRAAIPGRCGVGQARKRACCARMPPARGAEVSAGARVQAPAVPACLPACLCLHVCVCDALQAAAEGPPLLTLATLLPLGQRMAKAAAVAAAAGQMSGIEWCLLDPMPPAPATFVTIVCHLSASSAERRRCCGWSCSFSPSSAHAESSLGAIMPAHIRTHGTSVTIPPVTNAQGWVRSPRASGGGTRISCYQSHGYRRSL